MKVIMIHGIAQGGKNPVKLQQDWQDAISQGFSAAGLTLPKDIEFHFPFYGDLLLDYTKSTELEEGVLAKGGASGDAEFDEFASGLLDEIYARSGMSQDLIKKEIESIEGLAATEKGPGSWGWVQAILRVLDRNLPGTTKLSMSLFVQESYSYLYNPNAMKDIHDIVQPMLNEGRPTVVIGHSLGSVVGYRCLKESPNRPDLYLTIGSPLGTGYFTRKLGVLENPVPNGHWFNGYDERDVVALNPLEDPYFGVEPAIVNDESLKNSSDNNHGALEYLASEQVTAALSKVLR